MIITQTKLRSTLGFVLAFVVAYGPEVVTWIGGKAAAPQWLRDVAKGLGVLIGVLTSKEGVLLLNKLVPSPVVVPLLDGSSVVQVAPPRVGVAPSLFAVAANTKDVPQPAAPVPSAEPTPVTTPIRPKQGGFGVVACLILGAAIGLLGIWIEAVVCEHPALAETPSTVPSPQLGGCFDDGAICVSPSVLVPAVMRLDVTKSSFELVPALGGCYGISYRADQWWSPGFDACLSVTLSKEMPNQVTPALLFKFMGARVGADLRLTQVTGAPLDKNFGILFTYGIDLGASPSYMAKQAAGKAVQ